MDEWQSLDLPAEILDALAKLRFQTPTPIQSAAIPEIVAGHDVVGKASTGSGKTLAFGIPILGDILERQTDSEAARDISALVLSPTRELAHQISAHLNDLCVKFRADSPRIATITGGLSVQKQERLLATADIAIGTPGRLWEIMTTSADATDRLKKIKYLVLDEADRLLSEGHFKEVEEILTSLHRLEDGQTERPPRQTLIFSATFDKGLQHKLGAKSKSDKGLMSQTESLEYLISKLNFREEKPKFIDVDPTSQLATGIKEALVECVALEKDLYLYATLLLHPRTRTLIFTNSISAVRRITPFLQNLGLPAQSLHSNMIQKARLRAVERFAKTPAAILVATDVAARGLDIKAVELIVHYHLPRAADAYVHRSGRTARGDSAGASVILCAPDETVALRRLVARVHKDRGNKGGKYSMPVVDVDRRVVARLKPRAVLAKRLADVALAKAKGSADDNIFREAAEDLGVEYDSEALEEASAGGGGRQGRGNERRKKQRADREVGRGQVEAWRAELKGLLAQRVNVGVSERYLARGVVDVEALLRGETGDFLGAARMIEFGD
jgi:ATP-dependent RNA helicase DDX24/MAK5